MRKNSIEYHIQQRVGYACTITMFAVATANLIIGIFRHELTLENVIRDSSVWLLYLFGIIGLVTTLKDSVVSRIIHVSLFIGTSLITTAALELGSLHGVLFFVFGSLLALQYGFFRRHFLTKASVLAAAYLGAIVAAVVTQTGYSLPSGIPTLLLTAMMLFLFWTIFSEEIKAMRNRSSTLQRELDRNQVFVKFGRDVAGVVHNLRSALMSVEGYNDVMRNSPADEHDEYLSLQRDATGRMIDMVENFMVAVRSYQRVDQEVVNLRNIVHSAVELVQGNQEVKHATRIVCSVPNDLLVYVSPVNLMQVLDNLLMNAHESFNGHENRHIHISGRSEAAYTVLDIADSGTGIPWCKECDRDDCLDCGDFRIGKTTKQDGTGMGFTYVQDMVKGAHGHLSVLSPNGPAGGTTVTLKLPREPAAT